MYFIKYKNHFYLIYGTNKKTEKIKKKYSFNFINFESKKILITIFFQILKLCKIN